jgi:mRNA-degrading endonuclease toxin of MazEF toxin-antitoxin module
VTGGAAGRGVALDRLTLRFADARLEADFRAARFDDVIGSVRIRGIAAEVDFDHEQAGLLRPSVINCDGLHTITKASLTTYAGTVGEDTMDLVCGAVGYALGC